MPEGLDATPQEMVCPHCGKPFEANLLEGGAQRYRGFKCPNCRLFVAAERAEEPEEPDETGETEEERKAS